MYGFVCLVSNRIDTITWMTCPTQIAHIVGHGESPFWPGRTLCTALATVLQIYTLTVSWGLYLIERPDKPKISRFQTEHH